MKHFATLAAGCLLASGWGAAVAATPAGNARIEPLAHSSPAYVISDRRMHAADLDGDGRPEFIHAARSGDTALIMVFGAIAGGTVGLKQTVIVPAADLVRVLPAASIGDERLYAVTAAGMVRAYGEWPLRELRSFPVAADATAAAIGDIDADGHDELVTARLGRVRAYSLASGGLLWDVQAQVASDDVALGQLDADPQLEVVLGGDWVGAVLDGADGSEEGYVQPGFGRYVTTGHFGAPPLAQIVGSAVGVYEGGPDWLPEWLQYVTYGVSSLAAADLDGDGRDEILYGDMQHNAGVHVLDATTHTERFMLPGIDYGVNLLCVADALEAGHPLVAFGSRAPTDLTNMASRLRIVDPETGEERMEHASRWGRYYTVALGNIDGSGRPQQFAGAIQDSSTPSSLIAADALTGASRWESMPGGDWVIRVLALTERAGRRVVVAGGGDYSDALLRVLDAGSGELLLQVYARINAPTLESRRIDGLVVEDFDGDGMPDFVVATSARSTATTGAKLHVLSGLDGHLLTETGPIGGDWDPIGGLLLTNPAAGGAPRLILSVGNTVRGFDAATLDPLWTLAGHSRATRYIAEANQLVIARDDGTLAFHDADSQALLRTLPLPATTTAMLPLGGPSDPFLIATGDRLHLLDGADGSLLASSEFLGTGVGTGNQLAAVAMAPGVWVAASGGDAGYFSHRLVLDELIFRDGFD